jgi:hypothetical protein
VTGLLIGYARVSTDAQDLTAQRNALTALGVDRARLYVDHGLTGTNRERPGLREALAACRAGDTLVVTKLDRLARSVPDAPGKKPTWSHCTRPASTPAPSWPNSSRWPAPRCTGRYSANLRMPQ